MKRLLPLIALSAALCAGACPAQAAQLALPSSLPVIEEEAFSGVGAADAVIITEGTAEIRSRAFAGSPIRSIILPASVSFIAPDAFDGCSLLTFSAPEGSYAHARCLELGLTETPANPETEATRYVSVPKIKLYTQPSATSASRYARYMDRLELGECVSRTDAAAWYAVIDGGETMYVRIEHDRPVLTTRRSSYAYPAQNAAQRGVIDLALTISERWATTYAHGQSDGVPDENGLYGFDCSGLVRYLFSIVMAQRVPLYTVPADLTKLYELDILINAGLPGETPVIDVPYDELQAGDVLFFSSRADGSASTEVAHCGVYLGNGEFVHATSEWEDAVCIMPLTESFLDNLRGARRYLHETLVPANTQATITGPYMGYKVYSEKDVDSELVTTVREGSAALILYTDSTIWAYVRLEDGTEGYMLKQYLQ